MTAGTSSDAKKLADLITQIKEIGDILFKERVALFKAGKISNVKWELKSRTAVLNYVQVVATSAGLSPAETDELVQEVKNILATSSPATPTVFELELELIRLRGKLNQTLLRQITTDISTYERQIDDASRDLAAALKKLADLDKSFGAIATVISFVAALVSVTSGKFGLLAKVIGSLS